MTPCGTTAVATQARWFCIVLLNIVILFSCVVANDGSTNVTNTNCADVVRVNSSNFSYVFANRICEANSSTIFIIQFPSDSPMLENVSIRVHNVSGGLLSVFVLEGTKNITIFTERPKLVRFLLELVNVSIHLGNVSLDAITRYQSISTNASRHFLDSPTYSNSWTLVRIPWNTAKNGSIGEIDGFTMQLCNVVITSNTADQRINASSFVDSLVLLQATTLRDVHVAISNCVFTVNTSSTLVGLFGSLLVCNLSFTLSNTVITTVCAVRGCTPVLIMFGGAPEYPNGLVPANESDYSIGIHNISVVFVKSTIDWRVIPPLYFYNAKDIPPNRIVTFPVNGNSLGVRSSNVGVISISVGYDGVGNSNNNIALMSDMKVNVSSTLIFVWIAGSSVTAENLGFIDEFEMGVIVLSGHPERKNRLRNATLSVVSSSVTIRSSSSTMIRLSNINGSIVDVSITIADMRSNCNLFSQVRVSNTSSSAVAGLVYTLDAPLTNNKDSAPPSSIHIFDISSAVLLAPSGELLQSPSAIMFSLATVIMLSDAQKINITVVNVNSSALFGNGTVHSLPNLL